MNAARANRRKAGFHARGVFRIVGTIGLAFTGYSVAVSVYTERRWRGGNSRVFDPPNWHGYSTEERGKLTARRERFVQSLKNLYELKEGATKDPAVQNLFLEDCVLEDPKVRFVGKDEIIRAFSLFPRKIESLLFTTFEASHYEEKIVINSTREYELRNKPSYFNYEPKKTLRSNFVIYLSKDKSGEERVKYIADEWNFVSLLQPETHNAFMFAGSVAKISRRISAKLYYLNFKDHKSILNPFYVAEIPDQVGKLLGDRHNQNSTAKNKESNLKEEDVPLFNAGQVKAQD